ncbi:M35 family metallo-endopeptidase [Psychromonas sp. PT13]|uniref:M35 family metallo-endopeptidase n=1 Tax=Psychromonas sp. PT13 TaxID=3439547 RepID=UPI003EB95897
MITELISPSIHEYDNNYRGIILFCRFGYRYLVCKPMDLSEDALLGLPLIEFWTSSIYGEQFIGNLHSWKNDSNIVERLFSYVIDDNYLQANYSRQQMIEYVALQLKQRQLHIYFLEDKQPLFSNEHYMVQSAAKPTILEAGVAIAKESINDNSEDVGVDSASEESSLSTNDLINGASTAADIAKNGANISNVSSLASNVISADTVATAKSVAYAAKDVSENGASIANVSSLASNVVSADTVATAKSVAYAAKDVSENGASIANVSSLASNVVSADTVNTVSRAAYAAKDVSENGASISNVSSLASNVLSEDIVNAGSSAAEIVQNGASISNVSSLANTVLPDGVIDDALSNLGDVDQTDVMNIAYAAKDVSENGASISNISSLASNVVPTDIVSAGYTAANIIQNGASVSAVSSLVQNIVPDGFVDGLLSNLGDVSFDSITSVASSAEDMIVNGVSLANVSNLAKSIVPDNLKLSKLTDEEPPIVEEQEDKSRIPGVDSFTADVQIKSALFSLISSLEEKQEKLAEWDANTQRSFKQWFGTTDADSVEMISDRVDKTLTFAKDLGLENFAAAETDIAGEIAYVYRDDESTIYLGDEFGYLPKDGYDSKAGTIAHEISHFNSVGGTEDYKYGQMDCLKEAKDDSYKALRNADSFMYFIEGK